MRNWSAKPATHQVSPGAADLLMARLRSVKLSVRQKVMASMDYQRPVKRHGNIKKRPAHWVTARKEPPSLTAASLVTFPGRFGESKRGGKGGWKNALETRRRS